ncbi:sex comb on midleg-like protein 4 [Platysternon megacephalum]|uniref:Sex comb on midleg-like protein 4 n=1 Tax=Platysternon megacephalum TaxID=55544 RepID=A0A4D9ET50_9SAUR|nr:sex comb on midleg-like protein 4 [Platysternon megacephalum]
MVVSAGSRTFYPRAKRWPLGRNAGSRLLDDDKLLGPKLLMDQRTLDGRYRHGKNSIAQDTLKNKHL